MPFACRLPILAKAFLAMPLNRFALAHLIAAHEMAIMRISLIELIILLIVHRKASARPLYNPSLECSAAVALKLTAAGPQHRRRALLSVFPHRDQRRERPRLPHPRPRPHS